ncbi:MAG: mechanosensitive ion channel family protein [Cytophagaceae bacterium]|nr:mechanosensitive ion channel family protein [Cytophagaceae bacterium]
MEIHPETLEKLIIPAGFLISGLILGFIFEKIFLLQVKKVSIKARWEGGGVIINSLRGVTFLWFLMAGIYFALLNAHFVGPKTFAHIKLTLAVILIFSITILVSKLSTGFVKLYTGSVFPSTSIFTNLTKLFVFIIGMLVLLQTIGISVAPILTALGVGGLAVALALQDTLSNLFAGLHIIASKKVKPGDFIRLDTNQEGYLEDITWRNTSIRTMGNNMVIVPNNKMASAIIVNYSIPTKDLEVIVPLAVSYDADLDKVERITKEEASEVLKYVAGAVTDFEPVLRFSNFGEYKIEFSVVMRGKHFTDQSMIRHEFLKRIHKRYQQEGIEIPYPMRTIELLNSDKE